MIFFERAAVILETPIFVWQNPVCKNRCDLILWEETVLIKVLSCGGTKAF